MKRLLVLALVAAAAWYGWKHWGSWRGEGGDEVVIENYADHVMEHVRLTASGDEQEGRDSISAGARTKIPFHAARDGQFHMVWFFRGSGMERDWTGGEITAGPVRSRYHLQVGSDGGVVVTTETIATESKKP